jgi:peptidyl-prolyl cis-trans isomerase SurA
MSSRSGLKYTLLILVLAAGACKATPASSPAAASPDTWAIVDGRPITRSDVDKAFQRLQDPAQQASDEELAAAKLNVLDDLIVQDILLARAAVLKLDVTPADLEKAEADAKKNLPEGAFEQELARRKLTVADMREGLRRQLLAQKLITQEVESKVEVTDQAVTDFFNANRAQFNLAEESYRVAQIVVTPVKEPQVTNATGDDAATPQAATQKIQMLMERLKAGANFQDLATGYSEDPETSSRGGDMGLIPVSRLKQAPPALRDAVIGREPGSVNVVNTGNALLLMAVMGHEPAGQRDLTTPGVKESIRENLRARKLQILRTAYLTAARNDAKVEHLLAHKLVETRGKLP